MTTSGPLIGASGVASLVFEGVSDVNQRRKGVRGVAKIRFDEITKGRPDPLDPSLATPLIGAVFRSVIHTMLEDDTKNL